MTDIPAAPAGPTLSPTVVLDTPVKREGQEISEVRVRKPSSGELRGLNLVDLSQLDVNALHKVLPRITMPSLTLPECQALDPADLLALGAELSGFLLQKAARPVSPDA